MSDSLDRLYELLPEVYRVKDAEQGEPLRALLQVIASQVNVVENDIAQLYENWFVETAQDWVVPYIGDLVGYVPLEPIPNFSPRREVAQQIYFQRRKGTLALLELLTFAVSGWQGRAVEFYTLLAVMQSLKHLRLERGHMVDVRNSADLEQIDTPFDTLAHTVDIRRINSQRTQGYHNIPSVGIFVWRSQSYSVTQITPYLQESFGENCYSFSILGNDAPLFVHPQAQTDPYALAEEINVPTPISRGLLERTAEQYYGTDKSFTISTETPEQIIPVERIVATDLTDWHYEPTGDQVAVDPVLGRIKLPEDQANSELWVTYHYGFSDALGGGEYARTLALPQDFTLYRVGGSEEFATITAALNRWHSDRRTATRQQDEPAINATRNAVILVTDSGVYTKSLRIQLEDGESVYLLAANHTRPVIRVLDTRPGRIDSITIRGNEANCVVIDGFLITGRGISVEGDFTRLTLRHCTLVPGWSLDPGCQPMHPAEASLALRNTRASVEIERCILGTIQIAQDAVAYEPVSISIRDSILDGIDPDMYAITTRAEHGFAHAELTIERTTVLGQVRVHAILLAQDTIFRDLVRVARRQLGCMRFCYVPPKSRTPRRFRCQPDHAVELALEGQPATARQRLRAETVARVRPQFNSVRYGTPAYCQLAKCCPEEITRGAEDESELGAFHDLFQPQRTANLRTRLNEYVPADVDVNVIFVS